MWTIEGERWRDEQPVAAQSTDATLAWAEFQEFSVTVGIALLLSKYNFLQRLEQQLSFDFRGDVAKYGHDCNM